MKWFAEITDYKDNTPNGVYLLDDGKTKMYAFRARGTEAIKVFIEHFLNIVCVIPLLLTDKMMYLLLI